MHFNDGLFATRQRLHLLMQHSSAFTRVRHYHLNFSAKNLVAISFVHPTRRLIFGGYQAPRTRNGMILYSEIHHARGDNVELSLALNRIGTVIRLLAFHNKRLMGAYREALAIGSESREPGAKRYKKADGAAFPHLTAEASPAPGKKSPACNRFSRTCDLYSERRRKPGNVTKASKLWRPRITTAYKGRQTRSRIPAMILSILGFALGALLFVSGMSYGFKQEDIDKLAATGQCPFCDLSRIDLPAADLSGKRLAGARLSDANLPDAKLSDANLRNANLSRANLSKANLSGADLTGADLPEAQLPAANLSGANFSNANLPNANLSNANLSRAKFAGADLSGANVSGVNLSDADLSGATWSDGKKCGEGSLGECKKESSGPGNRPKGGRGSRGGSPMEMNF